MKLGLSSLLFVRSSIEDSVREIAKLGSECIEVIYDAPHFMPDHDSRQLGGLKELIDSYGLEVAVHGSFWDLNPATHYHELFELTLRQVRRSIEACRTLGGKIVTVHPGRCPVPEAPKVLEGTRKRYREFVEQCLVYSHDCGTTLAIENAGGGSSWYPSDIRELKRFVSELEGAKISFDIGHAHLAECRAGRRSTARVISKAIENAKEYLAHVHIHDNHGEHDEHLPPGDGNIDFKPVVKALRSINYDGLVIAELWNPQQPLEIGRKGMERLGELFKIS